MAVSEPMESPILGDAKSLSPTGVGKDPTPLDGVLSNAPVWFRTEAYYVEYAKLRGLRQAAWQRLQNAFQDLERYKRRSPARSSGGATAAPAFSSPSGSVKVVGYIYMGPFLEPARMIAVSGPLPEAEFEGEGLEMDSLGIRLAERHVLWAKDDMEKVDRQIDDLIALAGNELARIHGNEAALAQLLGLDRAADESMRDMQNALRAKLQRQVQRSRRSEGSLSDDQAKEVLEGMAEAQLLLEDDDPLVEDLAAELSRHARLGNLHFVKERTPEEPRLQRIYAVRKDRDKGGARTHRVASGESLSIIARRYYGDANAWRIIYDANRDLIKDPNLILPNWVLQIPPKK